MRKLLLMLLTVIPLFTSCNKDDDDSFRNKQYTFTEVNNSGISGVVMIREVGAVNAESAITIFLEGSNESDSYFTNVYTNSVSEEGEIIIPLEQFDSEGYSNTYVNGLYQNEEWDPENPISYDKLITFDGHILIRLNGTDGPVVATANIGSNAN
ncbi:hypothetical protein [uncultured Aquimarina sp.]|uniref:hypothetical protein n=1 Tax=uncultured Aquimarina sp. TaxID=575652 RepID=UPI00260FCE28|nr:hypothetical protein [uncultured Aquimarina sp.]